MFHGTQKLHEIKTSMSINKALLERGHAHSFIYCLWLFSCHNGRVDQLRQRPHGFFSPSRPRLVIHHRLQEPSWMGQRMCPRAVQRRMRWVPIVKALTEGFGLNPFGHREPLKLVAGSKQRILET